MMVILKIEKFPYFTNGFADQDEIRHDEANWASYQYELLKVLISKIQDGGQKSYR